jgi:sortase (surface protein transpeptidase)
MFAVLLAAGTSSVGRAEGVPADVPTPWVAPPGSDSRLPAPEHSRQREVAQRVAVPRGEPVRVVIPAIDVDASLVRLGLRADRSMQVPDFGLAGWYVEGPKPGHPGPAVIAAHVDSWVGPDVFFALRELVAGDRIHVVYDSGDRVTFAVESSAQASKDELPVDSIWPTTNERLLALITCGGEFDRSARHYRDNLIVYATPLVRADQPHDPGAPGRPQASIREPARSA